MKTPKMFLKVMGDSVCALWSRRIGAYGSFSFFFFFGTIWVQIRYYVVISIKVKLNHVSVKLLAIYIDEMQQAGGRGTQEISSLNGDEMSRRPELPSTGMCKEWQLTCKIPELKALVIVMV